MKFQIIKVLVSFLLIINIIACNNVFSEEKVPKGTIVEKDMIYMGDSLISDEDFINKIKSTCAITNSGLEITDSYKSQCIFYKIKFPYEELNGVESKVIQIFKGVSYIIKKSDKTSDADDFMFKKLIIKKGDVITDSIIVYGYENYIEALTQRAHYYYLKNNYLWNLEFDVDEEGISVVSWNKYEINEKGKIIRKQ